MRTRFRRARVLRARPRLLEIARTALKDALRATKARERLAGEPRPDTAVVVLNRDGDIQLSDRDAARWLAEHFDVAEHPGWLPERWTSGSRCRRTRYW